MTMVCGIQSGNLNCAALQSLQFPTKVATENIVMKKVKIKIPPKPIESKPKMQLSEFGQQGLKNDGCEQSVSLAENKKSSINKSTENIEVKKLKIKFPPKPIESKSRMRLSEFGQQVFNNDGCEHSVSLTENKKSGMNKSKKFGLTSPDDTKLYSADDSKVKSSAPGSCKRGPPGVVASQKLKRQKMDRSVTQQCSSIKKEKPAKMTKIGCRRSLKKIIHKGVVSALDEENSCPNLGTTIASEGDVPLSPKAAIRVAKLKSCFAGTILKAQQETLLYHAGKADRVKMQQQKERLQLEDNARIEAQNRANEAASRMIAEERQMQRERDREAARLVLEKIEKTAEFEDNLRIGKYFESLNVFASIKPLEELGLFLKDEFSIKPLEEFGMFLKYDFFEDAEEGEIIEIVGD